MQGADGGELDVLRLIKPAAPLRIPLAVKREHDFGPTVAKAFASWGVRPALGMAIARQESLFDPKARSGAVGDTQRGGAWGMMQMTLYTANQIGYTGDGPGLYDLGVNTDLAAKLCHLNDTRVPKDRRQGDVLNIYWAMEQACLYNSGHTYAHAPRSTREVYARNVVANFLYYQHVMQLVGALGGMNA